MDESFAATKVSSLQQRLGVEWPSIRKAHADTLAMRKRLADLFSKRRASDTSVVVFGSVARFEVTSKSDTDWILLVDGSATPEHKKQETDVKLSSCYQKSLSNQVRAASLVRSWAATTSFTGSAERMI